MMRRLIVAAALTLALASTASAAVGRGTSMFAVQLTTGTADLYDPFDAGPTGSGYISAFDHSEVGVQGQYWMMMSDNYAFTVSAGIGFFGEKDEPGDNASPGSSDVEYTQSSFNVRVGGDRVVNVGEQAILFFGPGVEYWSGKAEFQGFGGPDLETENVTRISLSGRIGATMTIGSAWGFNVSVGHKVGMAHAEDQGAKARWWASSLDSQGGIVFMFGGAQ